MQRIHDDLWEKVVDRILSYADRIHFGDIMDDLIEDAIKYSGIVPIIHIAVDEQESFLSVSVKEHGIGKSASGRKYVFNIYYPSECRDVKRIAGFGLGVTYVKSTVNSHGGWKGKGVCRFFVT